MHEQHWERLAELDREETAKRSRCRYLAECDSFAILLLNREHIVDPAGKTIRPIVETSEVRPAGFLEQLCILAYLVNAQDLPLVGKLVSVEKLDRGSFFFRGSHRLPIEKLANTFGPDPQLLRRVGQQFNAVSQPFGDIAIELCVLPRIPLTLIIWAADQEFPARTSILLDQSAVSQLPLDALFAAITLTISTLLNTAKTMT